MAPQGNGGVVFQHQSPRSRVSSVPGSQSLMFFGRDLASPGVPGEKDMDDEVPHHRDERRASPDQEAHQKTEQEDHKDPKGHWRVEQEVLLKAIN